MRWERLFDDLEAQLGADASRELAAEVADRTRRERAQVGLFERLTAVLDGPIVELRVAGVGPVQGVVSGTGPEWVLLDQRSATAAGLPAARAGPTGRCWSPRRPSGRWSGWPAPARAGPWRGASVSGAALRAVSRDRAVVDVVDIDGIVVTGTIDAVGQDLVEIAEHPGDVPRRAENVLRVVAVPFLALAAVRRR